MWLRLHTEKSQVSLSTEVPALSSCRAQPATRLAAPQSTAKAFRPDLWTRSSPRLIASVSGPAIHPPLTARNLGVTSDNVLSAPSHPHILLLLLKDASNTSTSHKLLPLLFWMGSKRVSLVQGTDRKTPRVSALEAISGHVTSSPTPTLKLSQGARCSEGPSPRPQVALALACCMSASVAVFLFPPSARPPHNPCPFSCVNHLLPPQLSAQVALPPGSPLKQSPHVCSPGLSLSLHSCDANECLPPPVECEPPEGGNRTIRPTEPCRACGAPGHKSLCAPTS